MRILTPLRIFLLPLLALKPDASCLIEIEGETLQSDFAL
jgi:hypothetical protein